MNFRDLREQAEALVKALFHFALVSWQLVAQPNQFYWQRSRVEGPRRREAVEMLALTSVLLASIYYGVVRSNAAIHSAVEYAFGALLFNVINLLWMCSLYALVAKLAAPSTRFGIHLTNVLCAVPVLCPVAFLSQPYTAARIAARTAGTPVVFGALEYFGVLVIIVGYLWIGRLVYASLRQNAMASRPAALFASIAGFALTLLSMWLILEPNEARLLRMLIG